jgi:hypothetical protein
MTQKSNELSYTNKNIGVMFVDNVFYIFLKLKKGDNFIQKEVIGADKPLEVQYIKQLFDTTKLAPTISIDSFNISLYSVCDLDVMVVCL